MIEGNKGLHDGVDPRGGNSSAALAKLLRAPVVLVIDTTGMARGIAPLLQGYRHFDPDVEFAGVILNKVGAARQESKLRQAIENYTDLPVLGAIGRDKGLNIDERHLGLTTPEEAGLVRFGDRPGARRHPERRRSRVVCSPGRAAGSARRAATPRCSRRRMSSLAVARDAAFGFYYSDDLEALKRPARVWRFSTPA